eukprot:9161-Hanusia_phi.AAC.1
MVRRGPQVTRARTVTRDRSSRTVTGRAAAQRHAAVPGQPDSGPDWKFQSPGNSLSQQLAGPNLPRLEGQVGRRPTGGPAITSHLAFS